MVLATGLAGGCEPAGSTRERAVEPPVYLTGERITDTLALNIPFDIVVSGQAIIVGDRASDRALKIFDSSTGDSVTSTGREGSGPGEFETPWSLLSSDPRSTALWVFDTSLDRLSRYDRAALTRAGDGDSGFREAFTLPRPIMGAPIWLADSSLVALGLPFADDAGRFLRVSASGDSAWSFGPTVPGQPSYAPTFVRQQAYEGRLVAHPHRLSFALAAMYAGRITIHSPDDWDARRAAVPEPFLPDYAPAQAPGAMLRGPAFRHGYIDITASENRIYALFSGRTQAEYPETSHYGSSIHVFDWDGRFLGTFDIDSNATAIAVRELEDRFELYAVVAFPRPGVVKYKTGDLPWDQAN